MTRTKAWKRRQAEKTSENRKSYLQTREIMMQTAQHVFEYALPLEYQNTDGGTGGFLDKAHHYINTLLDPNSVKPITYSKSFLEAKKRLRSVVPRHPLIRKILATPKFPSRPHYDDILYWDATKYMIKLCTNLDTKSGHASSRKENISDNMIADLLFLYRRPDNDFSDEDVNSLEDCNATYVSKQHLLPVSEGNSQRGSNCVASDGSEYHAFSEHEFHGSNENYGIDKAELMDSNSDSSQRTDRFHDAMEQARYTRSPSLLTKLEKAIFPQPSPCTRPESSRSALKIKSEQTEETQELSLGFSLPMDFGDGQTDQRRRKVAGDITDVGIFGNPIEIASAPSTIEEGDVVDKDDRDSSEMANLPLPAANEPELATRSSETVAAQTTAAMQAIGLNPSDAATLEPFQSPRKIAIVFQNQGNYVKLLHKQNESLDGLAKLVESQTDAMQEMQRKNRALQALLEEQGLDKANIARRTEAMVFRQAQDDARLATNDAVMRLGDWRMETMKTGSDQNFIIDTYTS